MEASEIPNLAQAFTPAQLKEMLLRLVHLTSGDGWTVTKLNFEENLPANSVFDTAGLHPEMILSSPYTGPDLHDALQNTEKDTRDERKLRTLLWHAFRDVDMKDDILRLVDEELRVRSQVELLPADVQILAKARGIAHSRMKKSLIPSKALVKKPMGRRCDFVLVLTTLINGWGSHPRETKLYISYTESFVKFLRVLREETKNSCIPPSNRQQLGLVVGDVSDTTHAAKPTSTTTDCQLENLMASSVPKTAFLLNSSVNGREPTVKAPVSSQVPMIRKREQGYTLRHGPWLYSFERGNIGPQFVLYDEKSYDDMYLKIGDARKTMGHTEFYIYMIHSLDHKEVMDHQELLREDAENERSFLERCEDMDDWGDGIADKAGLPSPWHQISLNGNREERKLFE